MSFGFLFTEAGIRLLAFFGIFGAMAAFELAFPRRDAHPLKGRRWATNLAILLLDVAVLRVLFPMAAVGAALFAESQGWGLFRIIGLDPLLAGILAFLLLDFSVWAEHVAFHKIPLLWRVHRVHHADVDVDVTTALRFHPIEIVLSMCLKAAFVVLLGAPVLAVLLFEIVLNGAAMFNHSNVRLPESVDRALRWLIVTPDMHRIHHSVERRETDSNYGFNFSIWDRLFRVYTEDPEAGQTAMRLGLSAHQDELPSRFFWTLIYPFRRGA
ncbi:sterol desaturase family protein [Afifella sp. IM 167]|uniref:sterol desaturase family protein n=1 Tax=Afifella sp. IM 167 TaxID=2033586 RepID=UPI001CCB029F|nr:sterol desaturase family protein [Afifella sp. IM 167]MBZ8133868.1 fatty acid hydroxylase [Afifella sp. IM 167]